ncbi:P2Y purinoceptor 1-like [Lampris incognitus]|uniref:P2Y purinoceptor 1-like n=1 Tax=Lampris incognitus TaxID=2546036 RepID=UPI0024B5C70D|nr:P2Y purinoceptor 1-like [Lampris incognitus]
MGSDSDKLALQPERWVHGCRCDSRSVGRCGFEPLKAVLFVSKRSRLIEKFLLSHFFHFSEPFLEYLNQTKAFCSQFENGQWYCYILLVLFTFALPVGILGNVVALVSYTCFRKSCSTNNVFLLNLALCDSAWILTLPFNIYFSLEGPYLQDVQIFCQLKKIFFNINIYGSILFLTLVSFDRYAGTVHPISSLRWWDVGKAKVCSVCVWIIILLGSIPDLFVTFAVRRPGNVNVCMDHIQGPFIYVKTITIIRTLVGFVLPFAVMVWFYMMTLRVLRHRPKSRRCRGGQGEGRRLVGKPLWLITAALLVFMVSFLPYHVMVITLVFMRIRGQVTPANTSVLYASYEFFEAMCSVSSCLDPVLFILASERFHKKLVNLKRGRYMRLCCKVSRRVGVIG